MKRKGYTLIELLLVIGIISILAAIVFPMFQSARESGRRAACLSNLQSIDLACSLYSQDYDDAYPFGGDPFDLKTNYWQNADPINYGLQVARMQPINFVLQPYATSASVWKCPSDIGFSHFDLFPQYPLDAKNSSYETFGTSYYYQTRIVLSHATVSGLTAYNVFDIEAEHYAEYGPSEIPLFWDGCGAWHGEPEEAYRRYNVLMADGHAVSFSGPKFAEVSLSMGSFDPPEYP